MTKKHFIVMAMIFKSHAETTGADITQLVGDFCSLAKRLNASFDADKFRAACGLPV